MGPGQVTKPGFNPHPGAAGLPQKRGSSRLRREPLVTPGSLRRGLPPAPSPEEEEVVASRELPCTSPRGKLVLPGTSLPLELTLPCPPPSQTCPEAPAPQLRSEPDGPAAPGASRRPRHLLVPSGFVSQHWPGEGGGGVRHSPGRGGGMCKSSS